MLRASAQGHRTAAVHNTPENEQRHVATAPVEEKDAALARAGKLNREQADTIIEYGTRIEELESQLAELEDKTSRDEYFVQRGLQYEDCPEGLEEAHERIRELEDELDKQRKATREASYTMPPCDLQELFKTAWEAANHAPNWPDEPNKRLDRARKALVDALMELGLIHATGVSA